MGWRDQNKLIGSFSASDNESSVKDKDPYTLTLVSIEKYDDEFLANFTSTLEVMVDDIPNESNISCAVFMGFWWERPPPHAPLLYNGYLLVMMYCVYNHQVY